MTSLSLAVILQASVIAAGSGTEDYAAAHRAVAETGKPMVVMVGAEWCPACQAMKQTIIPQAKKRGLLRKVAFAFVDLDREQELGQELTSGGPIPQLIMYRKTPKGWLRRTLIGGQSVQAVQTFIDEGVELNEAEKHAQPASQKKEPAKPQPRRSASNGPAQEHSQTG